MKHSGIKPQCHRKCDPQSGFSGLDDWFNNTNYGKDGKYNEIKN
jgi:hypothetical protein